MNRPLLSTYRLQMRGDAFTFSDAENLLDYLAELGISHVYLSPILTPTAGSTHGYDVTDPTTVSTELGGADGLAALAAAAHQRGLGLIVDIVPNHVGVDDPRQNRWWWDLLQHGQDSEYARYFDVDWTADAAGSTSPKNESDRGPGASSPSGRILLPVLGSDADTADLQVDRTGTEPVLRLGDLMFPIAPGTGDGSGPQVHDRQHYRLIGWRTGICGYRRFFSITSLAGIRQEDRTVFDASHAEVKRWFTEGLVDGVRVDHPDGLTDPAGYLVWLRELIGPQAYLVVEKIVAADEALEPTLPVNGTTGYDALREIGGLFIDPTGAEALTALSESAGFGHDDPQALESDLKITAATVTLGSELARLRRAVVAQTGLDDPRLPDAIAVLLTHIGVYRSDYRSLSAILPTAIAKTASTRPEFERALELLSTALAAGGESSARLQQLCGAVTAKAVEDCLFYRNARLVSLNEVGGDPERFGVSAAEFHQSAATRSRLWPTAMTTLTTHDTKRGEDVRARIGVLSQAPSLWTELVAGWEAQAPSPDANTGLFLWQNIFGVWPEDGMITEELRGRLHGYTEKAIREAGLHTTWNDPDIDFEGAVHGWLDQVLDGPVAAELTVLVQRLAAHSRSDALAQKLLALTVPGIPDVYQGTELWEDSLVDPDNRRPVDFAVRRGALTAQSHPKMRVVRAALHVRRERAQSFLTGGYTPVPAEGSAAEQVVAFRRGDDVLVAVSRWTLRLEETGWGDTTVTLPPGTWTDRISGATVTGTVGAEQLFTDLSVALLERTSATGDDSV